MIYFVQADIIGRIKIGYTNRDGLERRLASLRTSSPVKLRLLATRKGSLAVERKLHARFAVERVVGEWFEPSKRLVRYVAWLQGRESARAEFRRKADLARVERFIRTFFAETIECAGVTFLEAARMAGVNKDVLDWPEVQSLPIHKFRKMGPDGPAWYWRWDGTPTEACQ